MTATITAGIGTTETIESSQCSTMAEPDLAMRMAGLASDGAAPDPLDAMALLTAILDRLRPTLDAADFQALLLVGACLCRCASMEQRLEDLLGLSSGGTG